MLSKAELGVDGLLLKTSHVSEETRDRMAEVPWRGIIAMRNCLCFS